MTTPTTTAKPITPAKKPKQTLTGIIRSRMATYQERQLAGVSQKTFAQELTDEGHPISYADFRTLYARARKQLQKQPPKEAQNALPVAAKTPEKIEETKPEKQPENPLTKPRGFEFKGSNNFKPDELI